MNDSPPSRLICSLAAASIERMRDDARAARSGGADTLELRLDCLDPEPDARTVADLVASMPLPVIATCRPTREGGHFRGEEASRLALLDAAAEAGAAWVDVEAFVEAPVAAGARRIRSFHDFSACPDDLPGLARRIRAADPEAVVKIAYAAAGPDEALGALEVLESADGPTICLAMGEAGVLSRVLCRKFDAFGTFAALAAGAESAPGQPSLRQFRELYRWGDIGPRTRCFGVIGCPVAHSMSPAIHNAAFAACGLDAVYLPLRIEPGEDAFRRFLDGIRARPQVGFRGLSVTIPHKEHALRYVGKQNCDELSARIGAINTLTLEPDGSLRGENTDYAAALRALAEAMEIEPGELSGRTAGILGAGGAARAIAAALAECGAEVTLYNRTLRRAEELAEEFSLRAAPLADAETADAEILINCTPIGMHPHTENSPIARIPRTTRVVFDTIYNPLRTRLLQEAGERGLIEVSGLDMFVNQAVAQFQRWTGLPAPREIMADIVRDSLRETDNA